jgi:pyridoxine 5-phosphate synthase
MMAIELSVNINKVATIRNTRPLNIPSVEHLSRIALEAGAKGITIHPRPDHRHIRPDDVGALAALVGRYPGREFNIEGNPFLDYMPHIRQVRPTQCTLVPDSTEQFTSDHGWSLTPETIVLLRPVIAEMRKLGCRVSMFMDADSVEIEKCRDLGADRIELYTEPYARAYARAAAMPKDGDAKGALQRSLDLYAHAAERASEVELGVNAGHDLNLQNLPAFARRIPDLCEVSIGHALIADALEYGMAETVRRYREACGG